MTHNMVVIRKKTRMNWESANDIKNFIPIFHPKTFSDLPVLWFADDIE